MKSTHLRPRHASTSRLIFRSRFCTLTLRVEGRLSIRERRTLALALLRGISPTLRSIFEIRLLHDDGDWSQWIHAEDREVSLSEGNVLNTPQEKVGFAIRMHRLRLGLTQEEFAQEAESILLT